MKWFESSNMMFFMVVGKGACWWFGKCNVGASWSKQNVNFLGHNLNVPIDLLKVSYVDVQTFEVVFLQEFSYN